MQLSPLKIGAFALLGAVIVSGCKCGEVETTRRYGEIGIEYDVGGATMTGRDAVYDLGSVFMGQSITEKVTIRNLGAGPLTLTGIEKTEGNAEILIGETPSGDNPMFTLSFEAGRSLSASESAVLELTYAPPVSSEVQIDHEIKLLVRASNTMEGEETAVITIRARAISGVCELPAEIDFGRVMANDVGYNGFVIRNPTQLPATAIVGEITSGSGSGDHQAFLFGADSARGEFDIDPDSDAKVDLEFRPTEVKSYLAFMKAQAAEGCPEYSIKLIGDGVASVLSWNPLQVDCGYVQPGIQVTREVTFSNAGPSQAELTDLGPQNRNEFFVYDSTGAETTTLSVPAASKVDGMWQSGTATLTVACKPLILGIRNTKVAFKTNLPRQPTGDITVKAFGGGPDIDVSPSPNLNFGKVAYFHDADPAVFSKRKLTVINVGTAPPATDVKANLRLGQMDPNTGNVNSTYFEVKPLNGATVDGEFQVTLPASYDPATGLEAKAGLNRVDLDVTFTPTSVGLKQAEITIYSNDPDEPATKILVSADAVVLPPCDYTVTPTNLSFGLIQAPDYRDLAFTIKNNGAQAGDICLLSNLDIATGSHEFFSLPQGAIVDPIELQPQETKQIMVRVWPQGQTPGVVTNITGMVEFFISSPSKPVTQVNLFAQLASSCLTIAPDDLDYGTVQVGCSSATRTFNVYNTCSGSVTINSFAMQNAAGQTAGGPNCPGPGDCPEFQLVSSPAIPPGGLAMASGAAPQVFQIKYKPIDMGADTGALAINAVQNGTNVTYVVSLHGKGDTQGIQTDVFVQDAKPKADILLTIDNSCSMSDEQASLASNFNSFIKYAKSAGVDFNIAVTTTDNVAEAGRFVFGPGHPEKVLKPTTVDVETKFQTKVNLGTSGSATEMCFEPSLKGLTAPLINSDNAGFLRNEAALAIVCITDEVEQSPNSVTYYLNAFYNIKGFNRKTMFTFNAISGFSSACPSDDGSLAQMVTSTNGVKDDICTPDWSKTLEQLGQIAFGFRTNFFLTSVPDLVKGPITVHINGVAVPSVDSRGATVWVYDSAANSVNFEPMYVPEPGKTMSITYHTTCY